MKIVIREDKRDRIAKRLLTEEFSGMYEDVNYITDGVGKQKRIDYRNGDGVIMIYGDRNKALYICEDVTRPLNLLSYTPKQLKDVVGEWFSEFFELPVEIVQHVNKDRLN
jgi:hypothetical protein